MVVGRLIVVLLLCLTFAGDSVPTVTSPSQPATSVVQVAPEDFASTVLASDHIWLMEFHSSAAPQFGRLAKEMEKAAFALKGICKLGSMDLGTEQAQKHLKAVLTLVPVLPSFRLFARNAPGMEQAFAQSPFAMGQKKGILEFIAHEMPNLIVNLTDAESYTAFNSDDKSSPKAILFTEKKNTTLLYKALSVYFKGTLLLAEVREYPRLATAFGITKYPTLVVTKGKHRYHKGKLSPPPVVYNGPLSYTALVNFLKQFAVVPSTKDKAPPVATPAQPPIEREVPAEPAAEEGRSASTTEFMGMIFDASALTEEQVLRSGV